MSPSSTTPPALQEATRNSTVTWQDDLKSLFVHAKDRFADVVWELADEKDKAKGVEEIWGHKAVVYARAPPTFQARYFSFKPPPATSPLPYSSSPTGTLPAQSALSLSLGLDFRSTHSRSPSPFRAVSPAPSTNTGALLRLPTPINPTLFSNELEYLYTGKGLGAAFEFLFDSAEILEKGDGEDARIDKLRKDLVFMWRSRLYSDVRITLTGNFSSSNHENATAIFSSHRFILVSRSPYFHTQLLSWGVQSTPGEPLTLTLPSPPFTPASLHFTLGFIYTGTLVFSHRTFDLDTAFHIMRSASYLSLDTLYDEIQARIVQEMMHGLFHAFLEFSEYECITGGKWGTGGCRCRQCARRAPRVLEFAVTDDVKNAYLERGARRALVGLFGEGWCTSEFAGLSQKTRDSLVKGLEKRTTPINIFPLLFAAQVALNKLNSTIESWAEVSRDMIIAARKHVDQVLCAQADQCFEQPEWLEIMEANGTNFDHAEQVELIMQSLRRGMNEKNAAMLYQTLVSSILLRTDPTGPENTMLPMTSPIRRQVDEVRMDVLRWLRRRWLGVKQEGGFDALESWAAKEIAEGPCVSVVSSSSQSTARGSLKRKSSSDTIKESSVGDALAREAMGVPRGATLDIGIPCIISSKKARFRAYARYIGEVEGEAGPWVGVEVPMNDTWPGEKLDGRQWNDGSWGGIRYFDIGGSQSEWEFGEERAARRRRIDWVNNLGRDPKTSLKREGEQLSIERAKRLRSASPAVSDMSTSESRGLFVRPQQVLYVVDAVGSDL
ncbi:hypothetical protein BKA93DRAFT_739317 [Sparassis latifolia]